AAILQNFAEGKTIDPKGVSSRLTVKKRGQYLHDKEALRGGWSEIVVRDRPKPYYLALPLEGWAMTKKGGEANIFWERKASFMIWKTCRKNNVRQAFPELAGLMSMPERPDDFDAGAAADYELRTLSHGELLRQLH